MINHLDLKVRNLERSYTFYKNVLATLGYYGKIMSEQVNFSDKNESITSGYIYLSVGKPNPFHFAFEAVSCDMVDEFHRVGLIFGGTDNGQPGYRDSDNHYYTAFLIDPDGYRIEAVCRS